MQLAVFTYTHPLFTMKAKFKRKLLFVLLIIVCFNESHQNVRRIVAFERIQNTVVKKEFLISEQFASTKTFCLLSCLYNPDCLSSAFGFEKCLSYSTSPYSNESDILVPTKGFTLFGIPKYLQPTCVLDDMPLGNIRNVQHFCDMGVKVKDETNYEWSSWTFVYQPDTSSFGDVRTRPCFDSDPSVILCPTCQDMQMTQYLIFTDPGTTSMMKKTDAESSCAALGGARLLGSKDLIQKLIAWNQIEGVSNPEVLGHVVWTDYVAKLTLSGLEYLFSFEYGSSTLAASDPWKPGGEVH